MRKIVTLLLACFLLTGCFGYVYSGYDSGWHEGYWYRVGPTYHWIPGRYVHPGFGHYHPYYHPNYGGHWHSSGHGHR